MVSVALGVAALVSVHGFRDDVARAVRDRADLLLGADARLRSNRAFPDSIEAIVDSVVTAGGREARVTTAASMVLAPESGRVRLLQVQGIRGGYPFHGSVETRPEGRWGSWDRQEEVLVDPAVLTQLEVDVGDSLAIGGDRFVIAATADGLPTDLGFQSALGSRVYMAERSLVSAGLLGFGSLARYEIFLALEDRDDRGELDDRYRELFRAAGVRYETAEEEARDLTRAVDHLGRYLGLVGLGALLLGGLGVASAVHVFVTDKLTGVAVLRCIGARQWPVFGSYLLQTAALAAGGAVVGAVAGIATQQALPRLLAEVLPIPVEPSVAWGPALAGVGIGLWVGVLFSLLPLYTIKDVPPLRALRRDTEPPGRRLDPVRVLLVGVLAASVVALSVLEAPDAEEGWAFAGALCVVTGCLWISGRAAIRATRRLLPRRAGYLLRQGTANLFRPQNQTVSIVLALGFGVFVIGTVLHVRSSLEEELRFEAGAVGANLILFDVQRDQEEGVIALLPPEARPTATVDPIVPGRIAAIRGRAVDDLRDASGEERLPGWALRREYRNTYRDHLTDSEQLTAGTWWGGGDGGEAGVDGEATPVSLEADLARDLRVGLGDRITWDVGGRRIETVVRSLRTVDWQRFETNFFVVFEPGVLDDAPQMLVVLANIPDAAERAGFLRGLVEAFPNVSALDVTRVQETLEEIMGTVDRAVRFLALFLVTAGLLVLAGSLATSRYHRIREGALLKTLGARRSQVLAILLIEHALLGALGALVGLALSLGAAALLVRGVFDVPFTPSLVASLGLCLAVAALTAVVGLAGSRGVLGRPPLPVLREIGG
jgi:putative ABC transport system permease protein